MLFGNQVFNISVVQSVFDADAGPRMNRYPAYVRGGDAGGRGNGYRYSAIFEIRNIFVKSVSLPASGRAGKVNILPRLQYFKRVFLLHRGNYTLNRKKSEVFVQYLKQLDKLIHGQTGLFNDVSKRAFWHITAMSGNGGVSVIAWIKPNFMTSFRLSEKFKTRNFQFFYNLPIFKTGKPSHCVMKKSSSDM